MSAHAHEGTPQGVAPRLRRNRSDDHATAMAETMPAAATRRSPPEIWYVAPNMSFSLRPCSRWRGVGAPASSGGPSAGGGR